MNETDNMNSKCVQVSEFRFPISVLSFTIQLIYRILLKCYIREMTYNYYSSTYDIRKAVTYNFCRKEPFWFLILVTFILSLTISLKHLLIN